MRIMEDVLDAVVSHAQASGHFDRVNQHEPKVAPGNDITCAIWVEDLTPIASGGLNATSVRLGLICRVYQNMIMEPQDAIDPRALAAVSDLMEAYNGDFQLDALENVRCIDLKGAWGAALSMRAGYIQQDKRLYRVMSITLPIIIDDMWEQVP